MVRSVNCKRKAYKKDSSLNTSSDVGKAKCSSVILTAFSSIRRSISTAPYKSVNRLLFELFCSFSKRSDEFVVQTDMVNG